MSHSTLVAIFALLMVPGLVGVVLPVLPGITLMFVVALVFGFVDHFRHLLPWELGVLLGIVFLSLLVDFLSGMLGARYGGASRRAAMWGLIGLVIGLLVFPPFGGLIGLFVGVFVAEFIGSRDELRSLRAATGSLAGWIMGIMGNLFLGLVFLLLFILFALR